MALWQTLTLLSIAGVVAGGTVPTRSRGSDGFLRPTVTLSNGAVEGTRVILPSSEAIVDQFLGLPFAKSPPKRFSPPEPAAGWEKLYDGTRTKPACIQQFACEFCVPERRTAKGNMH
jgi:hypothetical protein